METIWVADLRISDPTAQKIIQDHKIHPDEVREAVVGVRGLKVSTHVHPERGLRRLVLAPIRGETALIVLYPRDDPLGDAYNLGSAYFKQV